MSLMQIAEPGESQVKEACRTVAVGIDLGTTNTLVACVRDGNPEVLRGDGGEEVIPSVVHYGDEGVIVGNAARDHLVTEPTTTIASAKRFVGRTRNDFDDVARMLPYNLVDDGRMVRFDLGAKAVSPIEVSAEILRAARAQAEHALGHEIRDVVITVPAYFDDTQRQATKDAGRLAGLEVMRLLAEPTAAALAYGLDKEAEGTFAVYDFGGGTFDISILKLIDGVFEVMATGGDSALGGDDIDRTLAEAMLDRADVPAESRGAELINRALAEARAVKERLTEASESEFVLALPGGADFVQRISRAALAEMVEPILRRTERACKKTLRDAGVRAKNLDGVILVGGSTRSPVVRDFVADVFGRQPLSDIDPDQVVALGAASQAHMLSGGESNVLLLDVIPLSLGIETMGGVVEKVILRNSTIPVRAKQEFTTYADNQTGFVIHVLQGERETVDGCRSLARFVLGGIPPMVAGMARVEIVFAVDADGLLRVSAREMTTGKEASIDVRPSHGLTDDEIEGMLLDSFSHAEEDLRERNLRIERVEAERILAATRTALVTDAALLEDDVREATEAAIEELEAAAKGSDHLAIRKAVEALDLASKPFAERRMNRAIRSALKGRTVADVDRGV